MEQFYKFSCLALGLIALCALAVTVVVGVTGQNPVAGKFGLYVVVICLALTAVLTAAGALLFNVGGGLIHKIGFYVMHFGAVILIVGFLVTQFASATNERVYADESGNETKVAGDLLRQGRDYDSLMVGEREFVPYGRWFSLDDVKYEQYEDGTPKYYEATVVLKDKSSGMIVEEKKLTVNHPQYIGAYKIYLMNVTQGLDGAVLFIKYNPGEYAVLIGVAALIVGTFLACFTGLLQRRGRGRRGTVERDPAAAGDRPSAPTARGPSRRERKREGGDLP